MDDLMDLDSASLDMTSIENSILRLACRLDSVLGREYRTPEDFHDLETIGYKLAVATVVAYIDANRGESDEPSFDLNTLAAMANAKYLDTIERPPVAFDQIDQRLREKWRHLIKHLSNLLCLDTAEDGPPVKHEEIMEACFRGKLEELGLITKEK